MPYIGNPPAEKYASYDVQHITTSATSSYVLDKNVANENEIRVVLNNVIQQPGSSYAYTASGNTLTLSAATTSSDKLYVVFTGKAVQTVTPPPSSVGLAQFNATGSPGTNTFLRGDNSWATPSDTVSYLVKISADDTTPDFLNGKLVAGSGISLTEGSGGGDETLTIANTSTGTTINNNADNRIITGSGTSGTLNAESTLTYDGTNLDLADSKKIRFGTGNDFEIYHDGSNSIIHDGGTGDLLIRAEDDLRLQDTSGYDYIHCNTDSSVELYHNKVKKLETASTGGIFTGLWSGGISQLIQAGSFPSGNATLSFSNVFNNASHSSGTTSPYQMYVLYFADVYSNAVNKITLQIQTSGGYQTGTIYQRVNFGRDSNGSTRTSEGSSQDRANLQSTNANSSNWASRSGYIVFPQPGKATARKTFFGQISYFSNETNSPLTIEQFTGMADEGSNAMTGFRLEASTSTWVGGDYYLYGLKGSAA